MQRLILAGLLAGLVMSRPVRADDVPRKKPETFPQATRALRKGVFLVGFSGGHGTAWVISKKHRLLATNAHVADISIQAC